MTSKGALALLEARCRYFAQDNMELEETYEARETIEKDLEVLDEIKNLLDANTLCRLIGIKGYKVIDLFKTNKKIKEWLEK